MIPARKAPATTYAARHCTEYGCRKCIARSRWYRRKQWRTRKSTPHHQPGRK